MGHSGGHTQEALTEKADRTLVFCAFIRFALTLNNTMPRDRKV
jgi:hypothetical protein